MTEPRPESVDETYSDSASDDDTVAARQVSGATSKTLGDAIKYGAVGGLVATLSMTVFRIPTSKSLPPTAGFWATFVESGDPEEYPVVAIALHLLYGVVNGVLFALLTPGSDDSTEIAETKGALLGTVFGSVLSIFGTRVVLDELLETNPDRDERLVFHISHVVYGLTLGTWVGSRFGNGQ